MKHTKDECRTKLLAVKRNFRDGIACVVYRGPIDALAANQFENGFAAIEELLLELEDDEDERESLALIMAHHVCT